MYKLVSYGLLATFVWSSTLLADESSARKEQIKKWQKVYLSEADSHQMKVGGFFSRRKLELHAKPLLSFANPASGRDTHGEFFTWTDSGRPAVIGVIWSKLTDPGSDVRGINHSLHTLASEPIRDVLRKDVFWTPAGKQVISKVLKGAPKPAKTERLRLAQMRRIAREFKATEMKSRKQTGEKVPHALRLQAEPIYRFQSPKNGISDGGLFAYFIDWDPDLVLLLESKQTDDGYRWHYSTVPFTPSKIEVSWKDETWEHDADWKAKLTNAYMSVHGVAFRPALIQ